jgi:hypothetical protein
MLAVVIAVAWTVLAVGLALAICSGIRQADRRAPFTDGLIGLPEDFTVADVLGAHAPEPSL